MDHIRWADDQGETISLIRSFKIMRKVLINLNFYTKQASIWVSLQRNWGPLEINWGLLKLTGATMLYIHRYIEMLIKR